MNANLFSLRNVKYKRLHHLVDRTLTVSNFDQLESDVLTAIAADVPAGFHLDSSLKSLEVMLAKYGFLDLDFASPRDLLTSADRIDRSAIRELGYSPRPRMAAQQQSRGDRACLETLMESIKEDTTYLRILLDSAWSRDAMARILDEQGRQQRGTKMTMEAAEETFKSAIFKIAETMKRSFPVTFTTQDACLTNSDAIWLAKHVYL